MLTNAVFVSYFISLGDGHSFVTRLVQIDPEQANSVLQQNGKRPVLLFFSPSLKNFFYFKFRFSFVCWVLICNVTLITALRMGSPNLVCLVTMYTHQTRAKRKSVCWRCLCSLFLFSFALRLVC